MKNTSLIIFGLFLLMSYTSMAQQNATSNIDRSNMDLPPGAVLKTKNFTKNYIDYSYKLNQSLKNSNSSYSLNDFLSGFGKDLKFINTTTTPYYSKAKTFFNALSLKVKNIYSAKELSYIYIHDKKLRNKLLAIK